MILGTPNSVFSWNYLLKGEDHQAYWEQKWTSEQCSILIDGSYFEVKKHGVASGRWSLESDNGLHCTAKKISFWKRSFEIESPMGLLLLCSNGALKRSFFIGLDGKVIATIHPKHAFSRHLEMDILIEDYDFPTMALSFWLVILTWRRQQGSGGSGLGAF